MTLLQRLTVADLQVMKAMLETAPNGHDPKGYYTRYRFAAVMNATVPSLGSRDDRRRLEELFDQVDTEGLGYVTWDSVSNFMYCMEENVGGSSKAQEKWELIGPGRPMRSSKELWHQQPLERVRYSAELDKFFTAGRDSCVKIWQGRSLAYQATVQIGQMAEINDVVYVPGKKTLVACAADASLNFFELHRGNFVFQGRIMGHTDEVGIPICLSHFHSTRMQQSLLIYGDTLGNVGMYVGQYKRLKDRVGKITGLAPAMQLNSDVEIIDSGHTDWVTMVHYCEKSELLISSSRDGTLRVTDMENRLLKCVCRLHARGVVGFDYSHELGVVASFGNERKVILWVVDGASHLMSVKMPSVPTSVALTPTTNQLVTLHMDFSIRLWDLRNGNPVQAFEQKDISSLADNKPTCMVYDRSRLRLITASARPVPWAHRCVETLTQGHNAPVRSVTFSPSFNAIVTADDASMIISWDLETARVLARLPNTHTPANISALALDSSGRRLITGGSDGTVYAWNFISGFQTTRFVDTNLTEVTCITHCVHPLRGVAWVAVGGWRGRLSVWTDDSGLETNVSAKAFRGHSADVICLSYDPGTNLLVSGDSVGKIFLWHLTTSSRKVQLNHSDFLTPFSGLVSDVSCEVAVVIPASRMRATQGMEAAVPVQRGLEGEDSTATVQSVTDFGRTDMPMLLTATADGRLLLWLFTRVGGALTLYLRSQLNVTANPLHQVTAIAIDASRSQLLALGDSAGLVLLLDISALNNGTEEGASLRACRKIAHFQAHPQGLAVTELAICSLPGSEDPAFVSVACRGREPLLFALDGRLVTDFTDRSRMAGHKVGQALPAKASSRVKAMRALSTSSRASESTQSYFRIHDDNTWLDPSGTSIVSAEEALNLDRDAVDVSPELEEDPSFSRLGLDSGADDSEGTGTESDSPGSKRMGRRPSGSLRRGKGRGQDKDRGSGGPGGDPRKLVKQRIVRQVSTIGLSDVRSASSRLLRRALHDIEEVEEEEEMLSDAGPDSPESRTQRAPGSVSPSQQGRRAGLDMAHSMGRAGSYPKVGRRAAPAASPRGSESGQAREDQVPIRPEVEKILRAKLHAANGMAEAALQAREERMNPPDPGRVMIGQTQEEPYLVNVRSGGTGAKKSESGSVFSQMGVFNVAQVPSSMDTLLESVGLNYITDPAVKAALKGGMVPKRRLVRGGERHGSGAVSFAGVGVSDGGLSRGSGSGDVLKEMEEDRVREHKKLRDKVEASMAMDESIDLLIKQSQAADMPLLPRGRHAEAFKQLMRHMTTHAKKKHVAKARAITGKRRSSIAPTGDGAGAGASEDGDEGDDYSDGSSSS